MTQEIIIYEVDQEAFNAIGYGSEAIQHCVSAANKMQNAAFMLGDLEKAQAAAERMLREIKTAKAVVRRALKATKL